MLLITASTLGLLTGATEVIAISAAGMIAGLTLLYGIDEAKRKK